MLAEEFIAKAAEIESRTKYDIELESRSDRRRPAAFEFRRNAS
jgi:hypothetical protein